MPVQTKRSFVQCCRIPNTEWLTWDKLLAKSIITPSRSFFFIRAQMVPVQCKLIRTQLSDWFVVPANQRPRCGQGTGNCSLQWSLKAQSQLFSLKKSTSSLEVSDNCQVASHVMTLSNVMTSSTVPLTMFWRHQIFFWCHDVVSSFFWRHLTFFSRNNIVTSSDETCVPRKRVEERRGVLEERRRGVELLNAALFQHKNPAKRTVLDLVHHKFSSGFAHACGNANESCSQGTYQCQRCDP